MINRKQVLSWALFLLTPSIVFSRTAECPANSATTHYRPLKGSQIAISVSVNRSGPYDFMVDTGAQTTTVDRRLAAELKLKSRSSIPVLVANRLARADLAKAELIGAGPVVVRDLTVAVQDLDQIQALNPSVRGILGENFLGRFDLLIDYRHKMICLDQSKGLQKQMRPRRRGSVYGDSVRRAMRR